MMLFDLVDALDVVAGARFGVLQWLLEVHSIYGRGYAYQCSCLVWAC